MKRPNGFCYCYFVLLKTMVIQKVKSRENKSSSFFCRRKGFYNIALTPKLYNVLGGGVPKNIHIAKD